jgi:hypothetical protein
MRPAITNNTITGGTASGTSNGIELSNAAGTMIADNPRIEGGAAPNSRGVNIGNTMGGSSAGIAITRNASIRGRGGSLSTSVGVRLEAASGAVTISANTILGGGNNASVSTGVDVQGSVVVIDSNPSIVGRDTGNGNDTRGIRCEGASTTCTITNNTSIVGVARGASGVYAYGIWIRSAATGTVVGNAAIVGCQGAVMYCHGASIDGASGAPAVTANTLLANNGSRWVNGIFLRGTNAVASNNLVFVTSGNGIAIAVSPTGATEATAHSNTVVGQASSGVAGAPVHLLMSEYEGPVPPPPGGNGVFRNNIAVCVGSGTGRFAAAECGGDGDPRVFESNDLFGCATLYLDEGDPSTCTMGGVLTSTAVIDALGPGTYAGTRSVDPLFVGAADYHLQATSMCIDAGTAAGAPATDFEGDARPTGAAPDIGYDEAG